MIKGVIKATHVKPLAKRMDIDQVMACLPACIVDEVLITTTVHTRELPHRALTFLDHMPMPKIWCAEFRRDGPRLPYAAACVSSFWFR
jgi:hypothetical protein